MTSPVSCSFLRIARGKRRPHCCKGMCFLGPSCSWADKISILYIWFHGMFVFKQSDFIEQADNLLTGMTSNDFKPTLNIFPCLCTDPLTVSVLMLYNGYSMMMPFCKRIRKILYSNLPWVCVFIFVRFTVCLENKMKRYVGGWICRKTFW